MKINDYIWDILRLEQENQGLSFYCGSNSNWGLNLQQITNVRHVKTLILKLSLQFVDLRKNLKYIIPNKHLLGLKEKSKIRIGAYGGDVN